MENEQTKSIREEINEIKKCLPTEETKKLKDKKFKLPRKAKVTKQQAKKNYVSVIKINDNKQLEFLKKPIIEQTIEINGVPRIATQDYVGYYEKSPVMILFGSSLKPMNLSNEVDTINNDNFNSVGMRLLLNRIELGGVKEKKKLSSAVILVILAILGIGAYLLLR